MNKLKEKLSKLASDQPSQWKAKAQFRRQNREWLKKSASIAVSVLDALKTQNLSQKDLAARMNVSTQQISTIVKGQENLTLETISNLETALGTSLRVAQEVMDMPTSKNNNNTDRLKN
jgi:plasmid maintenance system antidote protein VapI